MKNKLTKEIYKRLKTIKLNQNLLVFIIFLFVSSFFWFLNALNKPYYADITIPVEYINMPENKLVVGDLSKEFKVKINAYGYEIMDYKTSNINPVVVNLKQHKIHIVNSNNKQRYYILSSSIKNDISTVLGSDIEIKKIEPDSLIFTLEEVISKKVAVESNLKLTFKQQYKLKKGIIFTPDSVVIKGEKSKLDNISCIYTDSVVINQLSDSTNMMIDLIKIEGTDISQKQVNCILDVEKFTELSYNLPIKIINVPENYNIKLFPATAKLTCNVGFSSYNSIYKEQFSIVAYYDEDNAKSKRLTLKVSSKPSHVSDIRVMPRVVEYVIEKND